MKVNDERLLDLVEVNDLIYDRCNPYYKSITTKRQVWRAISTELGVPDKVAIKRYRVLRDRLVREKRAELLTGQEAKYRPPIMKRLEFLTPHVFNKRTSHGVKIAWSGSEPVTQNQSASLSGMDPLHGNPELSGIDIYDDTTCSDVQLTVPCSEKATEHNTNMNLPTKRKTCKPPAMHDKEGDINEAFCDALKSFKKLCQSREERKGNEALNGFGQMIISTIEGMSTTKQTKAMMRVTEVVMQIKLEPDD